MALGNVDTEGVSQSDMNQVQVNIKEVKNLIGQTENQGGTTTEGSVMAKLNALLDKFTSGGVGIKSVQRGSFQESVSSKERVEITINISPINPEKTFVILRGGATAGYASSPSTVMGYLKTLTETSFVYGSGMGSVLMGPAMVSYEVVEFY